MKKVKNFFIGLLLLCVLTSCSSQVEESPSFYMVRFDNEEHFIDVVQEVRLKRKEKDDQSISIKTRDGRERLYSAIYDYVNLDSVTEYYKPTRSPKDTEISLVTVMENALSFSYKNEKDTTYCVFVWSRTLSPEIAMNELFGRGAVEEGVKEYNGIEYVILQWPGMKEGEKGDYNISWVKDGKAFNASFSPDFTEEEMLEFCQFETVTIKEK